MRTTSIVTLLLAACGTASAFQPFPHRLAPFHHVPRTAMASTRDLETWTVPELKAELKAKGMKVSGKKSALIARLGSAKKEAAAPAAAPAAAAPAAAAPAAAAPAAAAAAPAEAKAEAAPVEAKAAPAKPKGKPKAAVDNSDGKGALRSLLLDSQYSPRV